jgi:hypothetical protein
LTWFKNIDFGEIMTTLRLLPRLQSHFFGGWLTMMPFLLILVVSAGRREEYLYEFAQYLPPIGELESGGELTEWLWFTLRLLDRILTWTLVVAAATACALAVRGFAFRSACRATWGVAREIGIAGLLLGLSVFGLGAAINLYTEWANEELIDLPGTLLLRSPLFVMVVAFTCWWVLFLPIAVSPVVSASSPHDGGFWSSFRRVWRCALWRSRAVIVLLVVGVGLAFVLPDVAWRGSISAVQLANPDVDLFEFGVYWSEWLVGAIQAFWQYPMMAAIFAVLAEEAVPRTRSSQTQEMVDATLAG